MKTRLHKCFRHSCVLSESVTESTPLHLTQPTRKQFFNWKTINEHFRFPAKSGILTALLFLILSAQSKAQTTDTTIFPLNEYLYTTSSNPYPAVNNDKLTAIDKSKFVNVMDYGAKGDGKTWDDDAIASAFNAAQYGVIFPSGKTFLVHKQTTIYLNRDITVYAYGATIKMDKFSKYSFLSLEYEAGSYHNKVIWLGGKLCGNKDKQSWPGSPTGNNNWEEDHGRFLGISYAEFALVKDVSLVGIVMDGVGIESCKLGVIADSKAKCGAAIQYNQVQDQGTYFKFTRAGLKACYFLNLTCDGGSIGTHISYPENAVMDTETISVHVNCYFHNQVQNAIHIEDCYKNFFYKCTIGADTGYQYHPSVHLSNRTGIVSVKSCQFTNARLNFNNASSLKLGIVDSCQFVSAYKGFGSPLSMFIEGRPTVCINSSFNGRTSAKYQAYLKNVRNCTFTNFDSLAIQGGYAVDSCSFITGASAANLAKGGFVISSNFTNVQNSTFKNQPVNDDWKKVYLSYIDILSDSSKYLGRIICGGNADSTMKRQSATTTKSATAKASAVSNSSSQKYPAINTLSANGIQQQSIATGRSAEAPTAALSSGAIKLYPNPTIETVHVTLNDKVWGKTALNIYDQQGRLVQSKTVNKNAAASVESLSVNALAAGNYVLRIVNEHQEFSLKFIVAK